MTARAARMTADLMKGTKRRIQMPLPVGSDGLTWFERRACARRWWEHQAARPTVAEVQASKAAARRRAQMS